jgi:hypothetical protein
MTRQLLYAWRLARSVFAAEPGRKHHGAAMLLPGLFLLCAAGATLRAPRLHNIVAGPQKSQIDWMLERTQAVGAALEQVDVVYEQQIEPIERVLMYYRSDERLARRVAASLVKEGRRTGISPDILLAVLLVENPDLKPTARSSVGARGLMQVMPLHRGQWRACPGDLDGIENNICYGAQIFRSNLRESNGDVERALLRYNGCVRGTNTPNCSSYPNHVFARAGRAAILSKVANKAAP